MGKNNSEEINFQHYVDALKQKTIPWHIFKDFMEDLSYSDRDRLRILNAILLNEMTMNYSDMDKLKYLNGILMIEFKNFIQRYHEFEMSENELLEDSNQDHLNDLKSEEMSTESEIQIPQMPVIEESNDDLITSSCKEEVIECNSSESNSKIFRCHICNKEYN